MKAILIRLAFLLLIVVPVLAWSVVKPVRVIAPQAVGMVCADKVICAESVDQIATVKPLYDEALQFVRAQVGPLEGRPVVVFCASQACAESFGLGARSAVTVGTVGTIIGPKAWTPYYVRHELIHQLQGQQFGVLRTLFKPAWLVEGMAYQLSDDPRSTLAEPWQSYRQQFKEWLAKVGNDKLWTESQRL